MAINTSPVLPKANPIENVKLDFSSRVASFSESGDGFQSLLNTLNYKENIGDPRQFARPDQSGSSKLENRKEPEQPAHNLRSDVSRKQEASLRHDPKRTEQEGREPNTLNHATTKPEGNSQGNQKVVVDNQSSGRDPVQAGDGNDAGKTIAAVDGSKLPADKLVEQESTAQGSIESVLEIGSQSTLALEGEQIIHSSNSFEALKAMIRGLEGQLEELSSEIGPGANANSVGLLSSEAVRLTEEINAGIVRLQQWLNLQSETAGNAGDLTRQTVDPLTFLNSIREVLQPLAKPPGEADFSTTQAVSSLGNPLDLSGKSVDKSLLSELASLMQLVREFRTVVTNDAASAGSASVKMSGAPDALMNAVALNNTETMPVFTSSQTGTGPISLDAKLGTNISRAAQSIGELAATQAQQNTATLASPRAADNPLTASSGVATLQRMTSNTMGAQSVWADEIQGNVKMMLARGLPTAELQLKPASLGALSIRIESGEDGSLVQFSVQSTVAKEQIEMHLPRLRELFAASQLELGDVSVSSEGKGENTDAQQQNNAVLASSDSALIDQGELDGPVESQFSISSGSSDGLLDVYA